MVISKHVKKLDVAISEPGGVKLQAEQAKCKRTVLTFVTEI